MLDLVSLADSLAEVNPELGEALLHLIEDLEDEDEHTRFSALVHAERIMSVLN